MSEQIKPSHKAEPKIDFETRPRLVWARLVVQAYQQPHLRQTPEFNSLFERVAHQPDELYVTEPELLHRVNEIGKALLQQEADVCRDLSATVQ